MSKEYSIQDFFSIGYLYLLLLGVASDSIYYSFFDITILSYSNLLDVLLSPVTYLEKGLVFAIIIFAIPLFAFLSFNFFRERYKKQSTDPDFIAKHGQKKVESSLNKMQIMRVLLPALVIFSAYLGFALGSGGSLQNRLEKGELKMDHLLTFVDGEQVPVKIIGSNSSFLFFVTEKATTVSVSPIQENVKKIEKIPAE